MLPTVTAEVEVNVTRRRFPWPCFKAGEVKSEFQLCSSHRRRPGCGQELHEYAELAMAKSGACCSRWSVAVSVNENWCCGETMHRVGKSSNCVFGDSRADTRISYVLGRIFAPVSMLRRLLAPGVAGRHLIGVRDAQRPEDLERRTRPWPASIRVNDAIRWVRRIRGGDCCFIFAPLPLLTPFEVGWNGTLRRVTIAVVAKMAFR